MVVKEHVWLTDVFIIVFEQWSSIAQMNKIYQALDTHTILVSRIHSLLVWVFSWNLLTICTIKNMASFIHNLQTVSTNCPRISHIIPGHETAILALSDIIRPARLTTSLLLHPSIQSTGGVNINAAGHAAVRPAPACTRLHQFTKNTHTH